MTAACWLLSAAQCADMSAGLGTVMTRDELYSLVWSRPMRSIAQAQGISDVALAKQCKRANVPVPPRGWWARKSAGKPVKAQPLPPLPFVLRNYFPAIEAAAVLPSNDVDDLPQAAPQPSPPIFRDLAAVRSDIHAAVKPIVVPLTLSDRHPIVARLLRQDDERRASYPPGTEMAEYRGAKFDGPIQQRRLRILSVLFTEFERIGCKITGRTQDGENFTIDIGRCCVHVRLWVEAEWKEASSYSGRRGYNRTKTERLRFDVVASDDYYARRPKISWQDNEKALEKQAIEIIRNILCHAEDQARSLALSNFTWSVEYRAQQVRQAKLLREKAEADRIAREKAAAEARIERLINGADMLERAARIRRYVEAVRLANASSPEPAPTETLNAWAVWALAQADTIDPVVSGRFVDEVKDS